MSHPHHFAHAHYSSALAFIAKVDSPFREHIAHPFGRETRVYHAMATLTTGKSHADHVRVQVTGWADQLGEIGGWGHLQSFHVGSDIIIEAYIKHVSVWEGVPRLEVTATSVRHPSELAAGQSFDPFKSIAGAAESFVGREEVARELQADEHDHSHRAPHHPTPMSSSLSHDHAHHHILPIPMLPGHANGGHTHHSKSPILSHATTVPLPSSDIMSLDPPHMHPQTTQLAPSSSQPYPAASAPTPAMPQTDTLAPSHVAHVHPFDVSMAARPQPVTLTIGSATMADGHEYVGSLCLFPKPKTSASGFAGAASAQASGMAVHH